MPKPASKRLLAAAQNQANMGDFEQDVVRAAKTSWCDKAYKFRFEEAADEIWDLIDQISKGVKIEDRPEAARAILDIASESGQLSDIQKRQLDDLRAWINREGAKYNFYLELRSSSAVHKGGLGRSFSAELSQEHQGEPADNNDTSGRHTRSSPQASVAYKKRATSNLAETIGATVAQHQKQRQDVAKTLSAVAQPTLRARKEISGTLRNMATPLPTALSPATRAAMTGNVAAILNYEAIADPLKDFREAIQTIQENRKHMFENLQGPGSFAEHIGPISQHMAEVAQAPNPEGLSSEILSRSLRSGFESTLSAREAAPVASLIASLIASLRTLGATLSAFTALWAILWAIFFAGSHIIQGTSSGAEKRTEQRRTPVGKDHTGVEIESIQVEQGGFLTEGISVEPFEGSGSRASDSASPRSSPPSEAQASGSNCELHE